MLIQTLERTEIVTSVNLSCYWVFTSLPKNSHPPKNEKVCCESGNAKFIL